MGLGRDRHSVHDLGRGQLGALERPTYRGLSGGGALAPLVFALASFAMVAVWRGDFEAATALIAESAALKDVTGIRMHAPGELMLAAYQGDRRKRRR